MVEPVAARQLKDRDIYLQRAQEARAQAEETTLENVRERCRRSEAAWMEMAARAERTEKMRTDAASAKAAALAEAAEAIS